jgi:hypothetical protein
MAETIPLFLVAQQVTLMSATPQTPNASGVLTAGATFDFHTLGTWDRTTFQGDRGLVEISPSDALVENHQPTKGTWRLTISELDRAGKVSTLNDIYGAFNDLRVSGAATPVPGGTQGKILVVIGAIDSLDTGFVEGRNVTQLTLRPCGILPQWSASPTI